MEIVELLILLSLSLVVAACVLFARSVRDRTFEHSDRLALLPLEDEKR